MKEPLAHWLPQVARFIERQLGIVYSPDNYFQLESRVLELLKQYDIPDAESLIRLIESPGASHVKSHLLDLSTNNETSFFRDPKIFEAFRLLVHKKYFGTTESQETFRVWSAASSTGQEALSVSMIWSELALSISLPPLEILCTDISDRVLHRAMASEYSALEVSRGLPDLLKSKYFRLLENGRFTAINEIRRRLRFERLNLCEGFRSVGQFDVIFCRNVLIYQRPTQKADVIQRLKLQLKPGGILIMGAGESMLGLSESFEQLEINGAIFYRVKPFSQSSAA